MILNLSWLVPGRIAGMAQPGGPDYDPDGDQDRLREDLALLRNQGIESIVSLTEHSLNPAIVKEMGFRHLSLAVADMAPPTIDDISRFVEFTDESERDELPVAVHCLAGLGRTGTMLACFLVGKGYGAEEALQEVRGRRPGSVETPAQEEIISEYAERASQLKERA